MVKTKKTNPREYSSNYFCALLRMALAIRVGIKSLKDFPKNLLKELKDNLNEDLEFILIRRKMLQQGFLTKDDCDFFYQRL